MYWRAHKTATLTSNQHTVPPWIQKVIYTSVWWLNLKKQSKYLSQQLLNYWQKILHFSEYVAPDPSLDEMRKVVCIEKLRPDIPEVWLKDSVLIEITKLMQETWTEKGSSRLTALRVKKSLTTIMQCSIITDKIWHFAKEKKVNNFITKY